MITFRPLVTTAQWIFGTKKHPESGILLNYDDDDYSQVYGQIKKAFTALTKDDIFQSYIFDNDFRSSKNTKDNGYQLYVFHRQYQKKPGICSTN